jgi:hypothetical protein
MSGITMLMTYAEVELMLANKERGWTVSGTAARIMFAGVTAAMKSLAQWDPGAAVSDPVITTYFATNPYVSATGIQQINTQYWLATVFNDYESFSNWRRTGFPVLTPVNYPGNVTGGTIPRRLIYPQSEASVNGANYSAAIGRLTGGDKLTSRVWWDKP